MNKPWIVDIETLMNAFVVCAYNGEEKKQFVIWKLHDDSIDQQQELIEFMDSCDTMAGFNNISFDYPVMLYAYRMRFSTTKTKLVGIYKQAQLCISNSRMQGRDKLIKQIDLFRLHHFDNKGKMVSLKSLQVWMNWHNVQEMPIHHSEIINREQLDQVVEYCWNDVMSTYEFYLKSMDKIEEREKMGYPNVPDANVGEKILLKTISKASGIDSKELNAMRSWRSSIDLKEVILPVIKFQSRHFNTLLDYMKSVTLPVRDGKIITEKYLREIPQAKVLPLLPIMNKKLKRGGIEKLNVIYKGFQYDFGAGGIHGSVRPGRYYADDDLMIRDYDVASYYPAIPIGWGFSIEHLKDLGFIDIYTGIFNDRIAAKKKGNKIKSEELKLALNGAYGKSNSQYSFLYDPLYTILTTINGQLFLAMLAERVGCEVLQVNTDGITLRFPRSREQEIAEIVREWEKETKMTMESVDYSLMVIRDVNNYLAVKLDGEIKRKGDFEIIREPHKDPSFRIIPVALSAYFIGGVPIETTFRQEKDPFLYFGRYKGTDAWKAQSQEVAYEKGNPINKVVDLGKTVRYIPVNKGVRLVKTDRISIISVHADTDVMIWNKAVDVDHNLINFEFFTKRCNDMINQIDKLQLSLV
jgi:hypothetical protein